MPPFQTIDLEARFWPKVQKTDGCWLWTAYIDARGYARIRRGRTYPHAHRVLYEMLNGPVPSGLDVCHTCDNRSCVRPDHLFVGTRYDNMRDMVRKGRSLTGARHVSQRHPEVIPRGEKHPHHKLTEDEVREARRRHSAGERFAITATHFGVAPRTIRDAVRRVTWKHVA